MKNGQMIFRVIIAGGRDFDDYELLKKKCDQLFSERWPTAIVCGEARGADSLGKRYANERDIPAMSFPADWDLYGKRAGYIRNKEMADNADALIAFWDGESRGTANMIQLARQANLPCRIVYYKTELFS